MSRRSPAISPVLPAVIAILLVAAGCMTAPTALPSGLALGTSAPSVPPTAPSSLSPSPIQTASPTSPDTPNPSPTQAARVTTAEGWQSVPGVAALGSGELDGVIWTGTRFIAYGLGLLADSTDGATWHPQTTPIDLARSGPRGIVALSGTGVAISPDGLHWTRRGKTFVVAGIGTDFVTVTDLVATPTGWLAVGRQDRQCQIDCGFDPVRSIVWTSGDGVTWKRVADQASLQHAAMNAVTRAGPGFVAVGQARTHGAVWTSTDGHVWSRVADARLFGAPSGTDQTFGASMDDVAMLGGHIAAVGSVGSQGDIGSALAWSSTDGRTWARATGERFLYGQLFSVAATPTEFLGTGPSGGQSCRGGIWSSPTGAAWKCIAKDPLFEGFAAYGAAASADVELVVGFVVPDESVGGDPFNVIWIRPIH